MSSKPRQNSSSQTSQNPHNGGRKKRHRDATVYDAVAGRCSTNRFIPSTPYTSSTRDVPTSSTVPIPPEEVLFRRLGAPERDIHDDFYWADRHLSEEQIFPDSDLLKAIHSYAADFYNAMGDKGRVNFLSMDETALLAVGMLLEETADEVLGETGDMVFVEGEAVKAPERRRRMETKAAKISGVEGDCQQEEEEVPLAESSQQQRVYKRRKTGHKRGAL